MPRKLLEKILATVKISVADADFELHPPDIVVRQGGRVVLNRYLVMKGVVEGADTNEESIAGRARRVSALLSAAPPGVEIRVVKGEKDVSSYIRRLGNELLNISADLERERDPRARAALEVRYRNLRKIYEAVLSGGKFVSLSIVVKITVEASTLEEAKSRAEYLERMIELSIREAAGVMLEKPGPSELVDIWLRDIGLGNISSLKRLERIVDLERVGALVPTQVDNANLSLDGVLIGFTKDRGTPVTQPLNDILKHMAIIGPTGRGKTTFLASYIHQVASTGEFSVTAVDFKGDLASKVDTRLSRIVHVASREVCLQGSPPGLSDVAWRLIMMEASSYALNTDMGSVRNGHELLEKALLSEASARECAQQSVWSTLGENTVYNLSGLGIVLQNLFALLLVGYLRHVESVSTRLKRLIVVDDAWRIVKHRFIVELVREGRSRGIGVVVATQDPGDLPREFLENAHTFLIYGSTNEDYVEKAESAIGVRGLGKTLKELGVGEAVFFSADSKLWHVIRTLSEPELRSVTLQHTETQIDPHGKNWGSQLLIAQGRMG